MKTTFDFDIMLCLGLSKPFRFFVKNLNFFLHLATVLGLRLQFFSGLSTVPTVLGLRLLFFQDCFVNRGVGLEEEGVPRSFRKLLE